MVNPAPNSPLWLVFGAQALELILKFWSHENSPSACSLDFRTLNQLPEHPTSTTSCPPCPETTCKLLGFDWITALICGVLAIQLCILTNLCCKRRQRNPLLEGSAPQEADSSGDESTAGPAQEPVEHVIRPGAGPVRPSDLRRIRGLSNVPQHS